MNARRILIALAMLGILAYLGSSLAKALDRVEALPAHRGYAVPLDGFLHHSIGGLDRIDAQLLDADGVLLYDYGGALGIRHNPLFIADFVLSLVPFASDARARALLFGNLAHLSRTAVSTPGGNLLFPYDFDFENVGETAPWYSAMAQARVAQAMMWGFRISGETHYLDAAKRAVFALEEGAPEQPLAKPLVEGVWLKEFPRYRYHVLDGSLVAIVGVWEVHEGLPPEDADRARLGALFDSALTGFKRNHGCFSSPAGGVYFADNRWLANQSYYDIIMTQLAYLGARDPEVAAIADTYSLEAMPLMRKLIYYYWNRAAKFLDRRGLLEPCVR